MGKIVVKNLQFSYADGTDALRGVDLTVGDGQFAALLGANGSGKTTLLKHLNGLLKGSAGSVALDGNDIDTLPEEEVMRRVGFLFQDPDDQLFAASVEQDVAFGPCNLGLANSEVERRVDWSLEAVGMLDVRHRPIHGLSFGEKKRVAIAGVLAMRPEVLVLDEPTGSLDPAGVHSIMSLLKNLNKAQGITMIMATHDVDLVPLFADNVVVMERGMATRQGSPEAVFGDSAVLERASLGLPQVAQLMDILKREDEVNIDRMPLTVGDARREVLRLLRDSKVDSLL